MSPANRFDGGAAVIVPQSVEKIPLYHWHPGYRLLVVGSRAGASFDPDLERDEGGSFQRALDADLVAAAASKSGVDAVAAMWCESLWFPQGIARLRACGLPLVITTSGAGDPAMVDELLPVVDAWLLLIGAELTPNAERILASGRHVECLVGLDGNPVPKLDWGQASAVHLVPVRPAADPVTRRAWYWDAQRAIGEGVHIYDEDQPHTDCACGERLIWRSGGRSRRDALAEDGRCRHCGLPNVIRG